MKQLLILLILAMAVVGCANSQAHYSSELYAIADAVAAQETETARSTRQAMESQARATSDALALAQQGTRQATDAQSTVQAQSVRATSQALAFQATATAESVQATQQAQSVQATATSQALFATRQSQDATATATREVATVVAIQRQQDAESTAVQATAQHVARQNTVETVTQPVRMIGCVAFMLAGLALLLWSALQLVTAVKARLGAIYRDERGDAPLLALSNPFGGVVVLDPHKLWSGATVINGEVSQPALTHPAYQDAQSRRANFVDLAKGGRPRPVIARPGHQAHQVDAGDQWHEAEHEVRWPSRVPLTGLLNGTRPTWRNLALGVTVQDDGRAEVVRADMAKLVHVAIGGSSGWGKSVFLQALAYQLAQSGDPVDLALVDLEGVTFAPFARCGRLLWPVADSEQDTLAILDALTNEMDRRKSLYAEYPGVADLDQYNAAASEPLSPVVALFDEATALLGDRRIEDGIKALVLRARKYGLWLVLGGQDWKASSLDTAIRNQLSSRFQFRAMSASQSRVLLQRSGAEILDVPGRALAVLPGRDVLEMQSPIISYNAIQAALTDGGPQNALPAAHQDDDGDQGERIREMYEAGASLAEIQRQVFGTVGGTNYYRVKEILGV